MLSSHTGPKLDMALDLSTGCSNYARNECVTDTCCEKVCFELGSREGRVLWADGKLTNWWGREM